VFSNWNFDTAKALISERPGKLIFDTYDLFAGVFQPNLAEEYKQHIIDEKFCIENSDGFCSRAPLFKHLLGMGYKLPEQNLFFQEYCWDRPNLQKKPKRSDGIHLAFAGNFYLNNFYNPKCYGVCTHQFQEMLRREKVHFHLYPFQRPGEAFEETYKVYLQYATESEYFHMHRPVPPENLITELSQYHLGMGSLSKIPLTRGDQTYLPIYLKYFSANKVFDYIDADLGVLINCSRYLQHMLCLSGAGIKAHKEDFPNVLHNLSANFIQGPLLDRVARARRQLSVWRHAPRLAMFYHNIASKTYSKAAIQVPFGNATT